MVAIDGTDALAFVIIRPGEQEGGVSIEAAAKGLSKPAAAYVLRNVADQWDPRPAAEPAVITPAAAAHVLWQEKLGGYPAGSFVTALLKAWWLADNENSLALSLAYPAYGAAVDLLRMQGGVDRLRAIAGGDV
jgi:hypothetical protein